MYHIPIAVYDYDPGRTYVIAVKYDWHDSPAKDYTVKVYSKHDLEIEDSDGDNQILYTDGHQPSEFTGNPYEYMGDIDLNTEGEYYYYEEESEDEISSSEEESGGAA